MYTMRPAEFKYHRPTSLDEAISLLRRRPPSARGRPQPVAADAVAAGCAFRARRHRRHCRARRDLRQRRRRPDRRAHDPSSGGRVRDDRGGLPCPRGDGGDDRRPPGAQPRHDRRQPRARRPGADYPTVLVALGATINVVGPGGERTIPAEDLFLGIFETALEPGELIVSVTVPGAAPGSGAAYAKHRHPASGFAVVGVAAAVTMSGGTCSAARIAVGGVAATTRGGDRGRRFANRRGGLRGGGISRRSGRRRRAHGRDERRLRVRRVPHPPRGGDGGARTEEGLRANVVN